MHFEGPQKLQMGKRLQVLLGIAETCIHQFACVVLRLLFSVLLIFCIYVIWWLKPSAQLKKHKLDYRHCCPLYCLWSDNGFFYIYFTPTTTLTTFFTFTFWWQVLFSFIIIEIIATTGKWNCSFSKTNYESLWMMMFRSVYSIMKKSDYEFYDNAMWKGMF